MNSVSVIIPVKNRAELLRKTLDNLLSQSQPPHEIIVVDDHSTDNIRQVIFDYITEGIFLNNEGHGPGAARNLGLSAATGRYIQFFDSDDLMAANKLEAQVRALEESGADMAYGPYVKAEETAMGWVQKEVVMQWNPIPSNLSLNDAILRGWNAITQACLFRREFLNRVPAWDEKLITHEDYLYLFRLSLEKPKLVHVPEAGVLYRQHGAQSTDMETKNTARAKDRLQVLVQMRKELNSRDSDWFSSMLFSGRLFQAYQFLKEAGEDVRAFSGYMNATDLLCWQFYRFYNKRARMKTGNDWEPMHGTSSSKEHFNKILNACIHG
jgi:glycosyltransferase involved in cell wall biosynthesis